MVGNGNNRGGGNYCVGALKGGGVMAIIVGGRELLDGEHKPLVEISSANSNGHSNRCL